MGHPGLTRTTQPIQTTAGGPVSVHMPKSLCVLNLWHQTTGSRETGTWEAMNTTRLIAFLKDVMPAIPTTVIIALIIVRLIFPGPLQEEAIPVMNIYHHI